MQKLVGMVRQCVEDYRMIEEGDKIAVGVSGGKDSLVLLTLLAGLRSYYKFFELGAITIDMGLGMDYSAISELCQQLEIPYTVVKTEIAPIVFDYRKEKNPCSMCSKMRRGALNQALPDGGYNKLAESAPSSRGISPPVQTAAPSLLPAWCVYPQGSGFLGWAYSAAARNGQPSFREYTASGESEPRRCGQALLPAESS